MSLRKIERLRQRIQERRLLQEAREEEHQALQTRLGSDLDPVSLVREKRALEQLEAIIDDLDDEIDELEQRLRDLQVSEGLEAEIQPYESPVQGLLAVVKAVGVVLGEEVLRRSFEWVVGPGGYGGEMPQSLVQVLSVVADLPGDEEYGERDAGLVKWVVFVLAQEAVQWGTGGRERFIQWGQERLPELDAKVAALRQAQRKVVSSNKRRSALLIWVRPTRNNAQRYQVSGFVVPDLDGYQPQHQVGIEPLENPTDRGPDFTLAELSELAHHYFQDCKRLPLGELSLEVFLPIDLLNLAFNQWFCDSFGQKIPLVCYRPLNLRSSERLRPDYSFLWSEWQDRWQQVQHQEQTAAQQLFCVGESQNLAVQCANRQVIAVHLPEKPNAADFGCLLRYALPVALWMRENLAIVPYQRSQIAEVLDCAFKEVPDSVLRKRQEIQKPDNLDPASHIGHHLALLWENPHLVPPNPEFEYPL